jgi:hypothetical protein
MTTAIDDDVEHDGIETADEGPSDSEKASFKNEGEFRAALAKRVETDAADPAVWAAVLADIRERRGWATITLATLEVLGVRGMIAYTLTMAEEDNYGFDLFHLQEYARMEHRDAVSHLSGMATDVIQCPTCGVFETCHEYTGPFPCDPVVWREREQRQYDKAIAKYTAGAKIGGPAGHASDDPTRYVVTRVEIASKKPSWWKGRLHDVSDPARLPNYTWMRLPAVRSNRYQKDNEDGCIWVEYDLVEKAALTLFDGIA